MADLGDIADFKNGKALPKERYSASGQWPVFGSNGEIARTDDILNAEKVISIGRVGAYCGAVYAIRTKSWVTDNAIIAEPKKGTDFDFLYYLLSSLQLNRTAIGSAQPLLTQGGLKVISLPEIPNYEHQKIIGQSLKALDDKIELNNQMNETLEAMAKAIFKEWFIDFGPVKAKAEGKKPAGMDDETAVLFPASFEGSEFGQIPEGWIISNYSKVMGQVKESITPTNFEFDECIHYSLPNFDNGRTAKRERIADIKSNKFRVPHSSILFSKLNPSNPRIWIANHSRDDDKIAVGSTEFVVIKPRESNFRWLSYCLLNESAFLDRMSKTATGTSNSHQRIRPESIFETPWIQACPEVIDAFNRNVTGIFELLQNNLNENRALIQTRDLLLPKLISGEIELKELDV